MNPFRLSKSKDSIWVRGEDAAAKHMKKTGCRILARNLRLSMGEIDILCEDKKSGTIVVVEVKARKRSKDDQRQIDPEASITSAKKAKLRTLTQALLKRPEYSGRPVRIDVVAVVFDEGSGKPSEVRHYESAI